MKRARKSSAQVRATEVSQTPDSLFLVVEYRLAIKTIFLHFQVEFNIV